MTEETVRLFEDGDQWCALMGADLQVGIAGFGETQAGALIQLGVELEIINRMEKFLDNIKSESDDLPEARLRQRLDD